jgi:hypothetical protein
MSCTTAEAICTRIAPQAVLLLVAQCCIQVLPCTLPRGSARHGPHTCICIPALLLTTRRPAAPLQKLDKFSLMLAKALTEDGTSTGNYDEVRCRGVVHCCCQQA